MYESYINDLTALFKGKREKARDYLITAVQNDPYNLVPELLKAPEKAWPYISEIIKANPNGVLLAILNLQPDERTEKFLSEVGYGNYIPIIREFHGVMAQVQGYGKEGIPLDWNTVYSNYLSGNVGKAVQDMKGLAMRGKELEVLLNKWRELKALANRAEESVPDIMPVIRRFDQRKHGEFFRR